MTRTVFSIVNQKGGVGKTTTAVNLATALSITGKSCLVIDLDPQGNASTGFAVPSDRRTPGTYEVLTRRVNMIDAVKATEINGLGVVPSRVDLADAEKEISQTEQDKEYILKNAIEKLPQQYSAIIVDCPPGLGFLTTNALAASDKVLIPLQCEFYALEGLSQILRVIKQVNTNLNSNLDLDGILLTMHDSRNKLSVQVEEDVREVMGNAVYKTIIPRNIKISESPSHGKPVLLYDHACIGSEAYVNLAAEVLGKGNFGGLNEN
ncbi:MAG: ParA family protein [Alphaproteobacteria bacterium]|tara:strand:+ start:395 stop:1186 length:792 start_codon:yes stop_codon:yes gene_type:complete